VSETELRLRAELLDVRRAGDRTPGPAAGVGFHRSSPLALPSREPRRGRLSRGGKRFTTSSTSEPASPTRTGRTWRTRSTNTVRKAGAFIPSSRSSPVAASVSSARPPTLWSSRQPGRADRSPASRLRTKKGSPAHKARRMDNRGA